MSNKWKMYIEADHLFEKQVGGLFHILGFWTTQRKSNKLAMNLLGTFNIHFHKSCFKTHAA